jgi:DNA polymerase IV
MDAFYAAIEQRDRPELRGKPVIVGGDGPRSVVSTCSYEARKFGVHSAMPGTRARKLCPDGIFVPPRMDAYTKTSRIIQDIFHHYTPLVEPLSLDEAFLDVTGSFRMFSDGETIARAIKSDVLRDTELTISVGVAPCKYVAKVASDLDKPDGLVMVEADSVLAFLAPLSISRLWGAGKETQARLGALGFKRIGDIQERSLDELQRMLGDASGLHFYNMSRGDDDRPVVSSRDAKSVSQESTFGTDLTDETECHNILIKQSDQVGRRLRKAGLLGRTIRIKVRDGDFNTLTRQCGVPPTDNDFVIRQAALQLFDAVWNGRTGIRLLGVGVGNLASQSQPVQDDLFSKADNEKDGKVLDAIDHIRDRYGGGSIRHGGSYLRDSDPDE